MTHGKNISGLVALGLLAGLVGSPAVRAADPPSTGQIIDALTPGINGSLTRGIRMGGAAPASGAAATPATRRTSVSPAAPVDSGRAEANLSISFRTGSATLSPGAEGVLRNLGQALASPKLADYKFRVEGHTDTVGNPESNKALSEQRAATVVDYLATQFHIDRARMTPVGMGMEGLLVETGPGVPDARNRRVLVVNLGG